MTEYYQVITAFAVFGALMAALGAGLLGLVWHLNNVIRDLRLDLKDAEDECDRLEGRLDWSTDD